MMRGLCDEGCVAHELLAFAKRFFFSANTALQRAPGERRAEADGREPRAIEEKK